jgi:cysteine desulfurase
MLYGGHQQKSLRPGTEPVHLVVGMALALKLAMNNLEARRNKVALLRESFLQELRKEVADFTINGEHNPALPFTLNLGFPGLKADILLMRLDMAGVACSTGSACSSGSLLPSPVLMAMQVSPEVLKSSMRFSFGFHLEEAEAIEGAKRIAFAVQSLRNHSGKNE